MFYFQIFCTLILASVDLMMLNSDAWTKKQNEKRTDWWKSRCTVMYSASGINFWGKFEGAHQSGVYISCSRALRLPGAFRRPLEFLWIKIIEGIKYLMLFQPGFGEECRSSPWPSPCCRASKSANSSGTRAWKGQRAHRWSQKAGKGSNELESEELTWLISYVIWGELGLSRFKCSS